MNIVIWEILIVLVLTLLNGFFACSEIALISVRKSRIAALVKRGSKRALIIQSLHNNPEKLFATIQIGISIITIAASAFAGSSLGGQLGDYISKSENNFLKEYAYQISFVVVVGIVAYFSLMLGELVPKSLGLRYSESFSMFAAYPVYWLSKISYWPVRFLSFSSNLLLKPFKDYTTFTESRLSEEEIRSLLDEGEKAGTIDPREHDIIENVFKSSDLTVEKIMVPRSQMVAVDIGGNLKQILTSAIESGYSRVPVYKKNINHIVGILYTKKLLSLLTKNLEAKSIQEYMVSPYFVPSAMKIDEVLQRLQRKKLHMAVVTNEHGEVVGLVTLEDVLEEIVGDIADETDEGNKGITRLTDDNFLVTGELSILDFNRYFKTLLPQDAAHTTVSGFILEKLGRFPDPGDVIKFNNLEFTVKETTQRIVKTVEVKII